MHIAKLSSETFLLFLLINLVFFLARACGQCLNFTCMFIILPMLRLSMTKLRQKGFNYLLPLDKHTSFHRMTGHVIVVYSIIHTLSHLVNLVTNLLVDPVAFLLLNNIQPPDQWNVNISTVTHVSNMSPLMSTNQSAVPKVFSGNESTMMMDLSVTRDSVTDTWSAYTWLLTSQPGLFGLVAGWSNPTGVILLLVLCVMAVCSMKWVRKSGNFEVNLSISIKRQSEYVRHTISVCQ